MAINEEPVVIDPTESTAKESARVDIKLRGKKGKKFVTQVDQLKQLIESVNQHEDQLLAGKREKEVEHEKYLSQRLEKFNTKRAKKRAIIEKYKERVKQKQQKQVASRNEGDESKPKHRGNKSYSKDDESRPQRRTGKSHSKSHK